MNTDIRFPRARSFSGLAPGVVLYNNNVTLPYGSPFVFSSSLYDSTDTDVSSNHLFCIGDTMAASNAFNEKIVHVGPYHSGLGVNVDNNSTSADLGEISLNLVAGANISLTPAVSGNSVTIAAQYGILFGRLEHVENSSYYTLTGVTKQDIADITAGRSNNTAIITNGFEYFYLAFFHDVSTGIRFVNFRGDTDYARYVVPVNNTNYWEIVVNDFNETLATDNWVTYGFSGGTSSYAFNISESFRKDCRFLDNTDNTSPLTVSFLFDSAGNKTFFTNIQPSVNNQTFSYEIPAGQAAYISVKRTTSVNDNIAVYYCEVTPAYQYAINVPL